MALQTQKQPLCKKKKLLKQSKSPSFLERLKKRLYQKSAERLVSVILRPETWHWVIVTLPAYAEKVELWIEKLINCFIS